MSSASLHGPGSPPRGRGKVDGPPAQVGRGRITPAQAGRSPYFLYGKKDYKDHPRIGGEKAELTAAVISAMGSPPRGRGKVDGPPAQVGRGRITPAQAGRSPYFLYGKKDYKDHPRIGGEKAELTAAVISAMGSPPRRRGKGYREFGIDISDRITPAQAGKSVAPRQKRSALWDHPRVGGEKYSRPSYSRISMGSPPRGRGKGNQAFSWYGSSRITPAWAGKSGTRSRGRTASWDHPRVGGEKIFLRW